MANERIEIKNFGGILSVNAEINKINLLITKAGQSDHP
jgi:hypothetical protein